MDPTDVAREIESLQDHVANGATTVDLALWRDVPRGDEVDVELVLADEGSHLRVSEEAGEMIVRVGGTSVRIRSSGLRGATAGYDDLFGHMVSIELSPRVVCSLAAR